MFQTVEPNAAGPVGMPASKNIRALLLDDSNFDRARIRRLSRKTDLGVELDEVDSIAELDSAVRHVRYDLILIDYRLPVGDGMTALTHILDDPMNRDAGKIMITGNAAIDTAVRAMQAGCHDFLTKDQINTDTLRAAMINALHVARHKALAQMRADQNSEIIKRGLVAALNDSDVQESVQSIIRKQMALHSASQSQVFDVPDTSYIDLVLADIAEEDEFIFH